MLQAHVCGDASAVVSEEAQPKLLVVNHMASLCFHTPLHRVLYRQKGWKKSGMRDVQTSRESWQLHPCSSLSANFTKAKPLEEPSGNRLMSTLSTCSCFHLEHDFLRLAAPGQCPRTCKESWERSWEEIGLIRAHFHSCSLNSTESTALNSKAQRWSRLAILCKVTNDLVFTGTFSQAANKDSGDLGP